MNAFGNSAYMFTRGTVGQLVAIFLLAAFFWTTGLPSLILNARAAALSDFSDTLSDSDLSALSSHRLQFTTQSALDADDTILITLDPTASLFTVNNLGASDFHSTSSIRIAGDVVGSCTAAPNEVYVSTTTETITLTVCTGDTISAGALRFQMGATSTPKITNPSSAGSRIIRVETRNEGGLLSTDVIDSGDARVYIIDDVVVTASVDSTFTFVISGVANGQAVNGSATTTATTTTATSIPFETLTPNVSKVLAQDLAVTTNAANGFTVTVHQDQNLTSTTGADINLFSNGATTSSPIAWATPRNTLNEQWTYGHIGITSQDSSLSTGDEFGSSLWAGNFNVPREVFYHTGPSDGVTAHEGSTRVGFQIEIDSLQEAGNDYTNTLTYIATPMF